MRKAIGGIRACWGSLLCVLMAASGLALAQNEVSLLSSPPQIREVSVPEASKPGKPLEIAAHVSDDDGVREVILYYRDAGTNVFTPLAMTPRIFFHGVYAATIPGNDVRSPGIEYYVYAEDQRHQAIPAFRSRVTPDADPIDQRALEQLLYKVQVKASDKNIWTWVALGALTAGVAVALQGGGGLDDDENPGDGPPNPGTTIKIKGPVPPIP